MGYCVSSWGVTDILKLIIIMVAQLCGYATDRTVQLKGVKFRLYKLYLNRLVILKKISLEEVGGNRAGLCLVVFRAIASSLSGSSGFWPWSQLLPRGRRSCPFPEPCSPDFLGLSVHYSGHIEYISCLVKPCIVNFSWMPPSTLPDTEINTRHVY